MLFTINSLIVVLLIFLAGIFDGGEDAIKFKTNLFIFQTDWWLIKGKYSPEKRTWLKKYIFSPISDGWHFLKFWEIICFILAITIAKLSLSVVWAVVLVTIALYFIRGLGFEFAYQYLWIDNAKEKELKNK